MSSENHGVRKRLIYLLLTLFLISVASLILFNSTNFLSLSATKQVTESGLLTKTKEAKPELKARKIDLKSFPKQDQPTCAGVEYDPSITPEPLTLKRQAQTFGAQTIQTASAGVITWELETTGEYTVPEEYRQYILGFLNTADDYMTMLYGAPSNTITVKVATYPDYPAGSAYYSPGANKITINGLPWALETTPKQNPGWDQLLLHEAFHAYHDGIWLTTMWAEEGMTDAAAQLVAEYMYANGIRDARGGDKPKDILLNYDTYMATGKDVVGWCGIFNHLLPQYWYRAVASTFWQLITSQSSATTSNWQDYVFLRNFNLAIYDWVAQPLHTVYIPMKDYYDILTPIATNNIDGQNAVEWLQNSPATFTSVAPGSYIGVLPEGSAGIKPINPTKVAIIAFNKTINSSNMCSPLPISSGTVNIQIYNSAGQSVHSTTITLAGLAITSKTISTTNWPQGAYRIVADFDNGGNPLHAENYFIMGDALNLASDGVGLIAKTPSGAVANVAFTSSSGTFRPNNNGAGAGELVLSNLTQLPASANIGTVSSTLNPATISVPLPYTRVTTLTTTSTPPTPTPQTYSYTYSTGWNQIALPNVVGKTPPEIFTNVDPINRLYKYNSSTGKYIVYSSQTASSFGNLSWKEGYWFYFFADENKTVTYQAYPITGAQTIGLPLAGWSMIGSGWNEQNLNTNPNFQVRNTANGETKTFDRAFVAGWITNPLYYFNAADLYYESAGIDEVTDTTNKLTRWQGYWVNTKLPNLEFIITQ